jgi:hypothetical protein
MYNPRKRVYMPKSLIEGSYSAKGLCGRANHTGLGRRAAAKRALAALGGKLEGVHHAALALVAKTIHPGFIALHRIDVRWGRSNFAGTIGFHGSMWTPSTEMI